MTRSRATHRAPLTESELAKARLDEARAIKQAWDVRLRRAQASHSMAIRADGDTAATAREIAATEVSVEDAAGELRVALDAWMTASIHHTNYRRAS